MAAFTDASSPGLQNAILTDARVREEHLGPFTTRASISSSDSGSTTSYWQIEDFHAAYSNGRMTPNEMAAKFLVLNRRLKHLNLFTQQNEEDILAQAEESTQRWRDGRQLSVCLKFNSINQSQFFLSLFSLSFYILKFCWRFVGLESVRGMAGALSHDLLRHPK